MHHQQFKESITMTPQSTLSNAIANALVEDHWTHLHDIYHVVETTLTLDNEDPDDHRLNSGFPRWKRNVLNVLQQKRAAGEVLWGGGRSGLYKLAPANERSLGPDELGDPETQSVDTTDAIAALEHKYAGASPEVKEFVSKRIERGQAASLVKALTGHKCQICEATGVDPISFIKRDGEPYVEAHHVTFVSELTPGALVPSNIITVCANHHRQLHYGRSELLQTTAEHFVFRIDDGEVNVRRNVVQS
jgi:hypothetical protein